MATIKDIAKAAGVSHGTASSVLNKRGGVSYKKIRLVEQAAVKMGYAIDEKASLLRRGKTCTIAVLLPNLSERRYADLYIGMVNYAVQHAYDLRLFLTDDLPYLETNAVKEAASIKACGVLAVSCLDRHRKEYEVLLARKVPLLFLERAPVDTSLPAYTFDMKQAAQLACAQLEDPTSTYVLMSDFHFADQAAFCAHLHLTADAFFEDVRAGQPPAINELVNRQTVPKSVICTNEALADKLSHVWQQCREEKLSIITLASLRSSPNPHYNSVTLNYRLMGHEAATALITQVEKKGGLTSRVLAAYGSNTLASVSAASGHRVLRVLTHGTPSTAALEQLLPRFARSTGIEVEMLNCSLDEFYRRINSPDIRTWDVVRIDPSMLSYLAPRLLKPLEDIDASARKNQCRFIPHLCEDYSSVGGVLYALPFDISVQMLFYQRSLLEDVGQDRAYYERTQQQLKVPATYSEFDKVCRFFSRIHRLDSPSSYGVSFPPTNPTSVASDYLPRLLEAGGLTYDRKGRLDLSTPAALTTFRDYVANAACGHRQRTNSWSEVAASFVKGETAMTILYVHHAANFVLARQANVGVEIGFAPVPGGRPLLAGGSLAVVKHSVQQEEAYQFIAWATGDQIAPELVMRGGISPCRKVYEHRDILDTYPWLEAMPQFIREGIRKPILSSADIDYNQRDFEYALGRHLLHAISGIESPEEALRNIRRVLDGIGGLDHGVTELSATVGAATH